MFLIDLANALRRVLKFIDDDGRDDQLKAPGFDLREELSARRVDPRIEDAAVNGSVGINTDGHGHGHGGSIADKGWKSSRGLRRTAQQGAALGDVGTVADLFATVLRPIAEQRGLETWEQLAADAAEELVPSRIAFGQHKGRSIAEARTRFGSLRNPLGGRIINDTLRSCPIRTHCRFSFSAPLRTTSRCAHG